MSGTYVHRSGNKPHKHDQKQLSMNQLCTNPFMQIQIAAKVDVLTTYQIATFKRTGSPTVDLYFKKNNLIPSNPG